MAAKNDSRITVGHLPRKISQICSIFLMGGGTITATVTGRRRYSSDLAQGGLEIPCDLRCSGEERRLRIDDIASSQVHSDHASYVIMRHIYNTNFNDAN